MRQYDFTSAASQLKMKQIEQYVRRAARGRTLGQIAVALTMSQSGVGPYVTELCDQKVIHIAEQAQATQGGHTPAIYQHGPAPSRERRKAAYMNDEMLANFFGSNFHDRRKT